MKRSLGILAIAAVAACGGAGVATVAEAAGPKTPVRTVTDWSGDDEGQRVIRVTVDGKQVTCIETKDAYGQSWPSAEKPRGFSVGISCDWSAK